MKNRRSNYRRKAGSALSALAAGFTDAGVGFVTNYPGFHSNELTDMMGCEHMSVSEDAAFSTAWGAAMAGERSVVSIKNVGLNDAADPFLNAHLLQLNAGLVVVVFDDMDAEFSQMVQDSRPYASFHGGLWFEPADKQDAYDIAVCAHEYAERFGCPVVIRVTNILYKDSFKTGGYWRRNRPVSFSKRKFVKNSEYTVVHPSNIVEQEHRWGEQRKAIADFVMSMHTAPEKKHRALALLAGSTLKNTVRRDADICRIRTFPVPKALIRDMIGVYDEISVYEHGLPVVLGEVQKICAEESEAKMSHHRTVGRKPNRRYHCRDEFEKLYSLLRERTGGSIVVGDLGEHTMDSERTVDLCLSYGQSVAVAGGVAAVKNDVDVFAVTGDGAFVHSGRNSLDEFVSRGVSLTVIVFDNGGCRGTGGQSLPGGRLSFCSDSLSVRTADFAAVTSEELGIMLDAATDEDGVSIIILNTAELLL